MKTKRNHARADDQTILTASIPVEMKKTLQDYATATDSDVSKVVRKFIRESLAEYGIKKSDIKEEL